MDNDYDLSAMYELLERWPKIAALVGEAQPDTELYSILSSGTDTEIRAELKKRDLSEAELRAFNEDIAPWLAIAKERGWTV